MSKPIDPTRRDFFKSAGLSGIALTQISLISQLDKLEAAPKDSKKEKTKGPTDDVQLPNGYSYNVVASWGDKINSTGETFGFNNDFTAFLQPKGLEKNEAILWVNHEYPHPLMVSGYDEKGEKTKSQIDAERKVVGGSIVKIQEKNGGWHLVQDDKWNRRIDGTTSIPFADDVKILGENTAIGTFGNCAGGVTPWGSVLTCEENFQDYVGDVKMEGGKRIIDTTESYLQWYRSYPLPPEHYGWVVEVDIVTGKAKKLTTLGRFAHEGATVTRAKDGRIVVYTGDDKADECFYKFVSDSNDSLSSGTLYVAQLATGRWLPLSWKSENVLRENFSSQLDVLIFARKASRIVGASQLDRPEGVAINERTGEVYLSLTNNTAKGNYYGYIAKFAEKNGDAGALEFTSSIFLSGGPKLGMACPDNIIMDRNENLWITSDISSGKTGKVPYETFAANGLFYCPTKGEKSGKVESIALGPIDCEMTGMSLSADQSTLFVSIQHPGETTSDLKKATSRWNGRGGVPRPGVIAITGPGLKAKIG